MSGWDEYFGCDESNENHATRHGVEIHEIEEALLDQDQVTGAAYSVGQERREAIIGKTGGRIVFVVYTIRDGRVVRFPLGRPRTRRRGGTDGEREKEHDRDTQLR